jgi:O-antigen ligase
VFHPGTFSKLYTRPAGFMKDPNAGAATVTILAIATVDWTRSRASDMLLWLIAGTAVVATLSRGGMVLLAVAFLFYSVVLARSALQLYAKRLSMVLVAAAIIVPLYSIANLGSTVYSADNRRVQLLAALLGGEPTSLTADSRVELALDYIDSISARPIVGHGTGFIHSQPKAPHNTFLTLWVENGILGLAGYLMLIGIAFWYFRRRADARGQAFCAATFVLSVFANDALDMRPLIVALGLLSVLALPEELAPSQRARPRTARALAEWA